MDMGVVGLEITVNEAACHEEYGCFAFFFAEDPHWPIGSSVRPKVGGHELEAVKVVAWQEIIMRDEQGGIQHGYLYIFASELKAETSDFVGTSMILKPEMVNCYRQYGYVALPFATENGLPIGSGIRFTNIGHYLTEGRIIAVQRFKPSWRYLFIVKQAM